jgi:hypothetical protein
MANQKFHVEPMYQAGDDFCVNLTSLFHNRKDVKITELSVMNPGKSSIDFLWSLRSNGLDIVTDVDHPSTIFNHITHIPMYILNASTILLVAKPQFEKNTKLSDVQKLAPHLVITAEMEAPAIVSCLVQRQVISRPNRKTIVVQNGIMGIEC